MAAAACSIAGFAPQIIKIWQTKDAWAVRLKTYSLTVACVVLCVVYSLRIGAWLIVAAKECAFVVRPGMPAMKRRFARV